MRTSLLAGDLTSGAYYSQRHEMIQAIARGLQAGRLARAASGAPWVWPQALQDYFRQPDPPGGLAPGGKGFQPLITWGALGPEEEKAIIIVSGPSSR